MAALPAHERAALLLRVADGIEAREEELARLLATENGKPIQQTRGELARVDPHLPRLRARRPSGCSAASCRSTRCPGWSATWR